MSKAGEEMVLELASLLGSNVVKTAAAKDDDDDEKKDKPCKCGKKDCGCGCKGDSDKCKCKKEDKKPDKKAFVMAGVLKSLVKLAGDLDDIGADEASTMVDEALKIIVKNFERKNAMSMYDDDDEEEELEGGQEDVSLEATEMFEDEPPSLEGPDIMHGVELPPEHGKESQEGSALPAGGGIELGQPMNDDPADLKRENLTADEQELFEKLLSKMR